MNKFSDCHIKNIEQLLYYVSDGKYSEVIKKFIKSRKEILLILDEIEQRIIQKIIDVTPQVMLGLLEQISVPDCLEWATKLASVENNDVLINIKETKSAIQKLQVSFEITLSKTLNRVQELVQQTLQSINDETEYQKDVLIQRLIRKDEGIALENNGILFDGNTATACVFQPKLDGIKLKGLYQPVLFDGVYFEQPFNSKGDPHVIKYSLHKGFNLSEAIYEEEFELCDTIIPDTMKVNNNDCYLITFKNPILLSSDTKYSLLASTSQQDFFGTIQYLEKAQDNQLIKFQEKTYDAHDFKRPGNLQEIISEHDKGLFPALIITKE